VSAAHVIVVGSINADLVVSVDRLPAAGETVAGGRFSRHGGGKGANQAVAAARLGAKVTMVGAVGDDPFGEEAVTLLRDEGIDIASVAWLGATETGVALITVDAAGENQIAVASGANARLDGTAVEGLVAAAVAAVPSGTAAPAAADAHHPVILLGHEVPETVVLAGARAAGGATIVLNPAPARRLPDELLACRPILTPNTSEATELCDEREPEAAAAALAARSEAPVLVTLGARGVLLCSDGNHELLAAPAVDAVDTTGAGDAFNGALAAELAAGRDVREAARFAVVAAALSTRAVGARDGMPRRGEVEAALA
jgi:ribokinase